MTETKTEIEMEMETDAAVAAYQTAVGAVVTARRLDREAMADSAAAEEAIRAAEKAIRAAEKALVVAKRVSAAVAVLADAPRPAASVSELRVWGAAQRRSDAAHGAVQTACELSIQAQIALDVARELEFRAAARAGSAARKAD